MPHPVFAVPSPRLLDPGLAAGAIAIVIDQLRASTTMCHALASGAAALLPCSTPEQARALRLDPPAYLRGLPVVLGGERQGVRIDGFDLGNSPTEYTPQAVGGRLIGFTTTNGTAAIAAVQPHAQRVVIGCLANLSAAASVAATANLPVLLLGAGVRNELCLEDCMAIGAFACALAERGCNLLDPSGDDFALLCAEVYYRAAARPGGVLEGLTVSRGGRNLLSVGLAADVPVCAARDSLTVVPELDRATGVIWGQGTPNSAADAV